MHDEDDNKQAIRLAKLDKSIRVVLVVVVVVVLLQQQQRLVFQATLRSDKLQLTSPSDAGPSFARFVIIWASLDLVLFGP